MAKTAALSLRIEPSLKAALEEAAAADRRSLAAYVEIVLQDHVTKRGLVMKPSDDQRPKAD